MQLNWLDYALIVLVGLSTAEGIARGFARVGIGLAAAILGVVLGIWFYGTAGGVFAPYVSSRNIANLIGFVLVFLVCVVVGGLLAKGLAWLFRWAGLSWMDRTLGALFGFVRGVVAAIAVVLVLVAFTPKPPPRSVAESRYAPYLVGAAAVLTEIAPRELRDGFIASYNQIKDLWRKAVPKQTVRLPETEL